MPLGQFFEDQLDDLQAFLEAPGTVVQVVQVDPEFRAIFLKMLTGLDGREDFPHLLIGHDGRFTGPVQWFAELQDQLESGLSRHAPELAAAGIATANPARDPRGRGPWPFLLRAEHFAGALPDGCGSLTFVLDPTEIDDAGGFVRSIEFLADNVRSRWLKFIVLDQRLTPCLAELANTHERVGLQTFWCSPQELQRRLDAMLARNAAGSSPDARRVRSMAASAAFANRDYPRALALQRELLRAAESDAAPAEQAIAAYGLGNTLLAAGRTEMAVKTFMRACQLCSQHAQHELAPMAYINLGVALHRLGDFDQAFAALRVGSTFYRAQGNLPGEAFACDNLALIYQELGRTADADKVWRYALGRYESITNPGMVDVREAGRADILAKLARLAAGDAA